LREEGRANTKDLFNALHPPGTYPEPVVGIEDVNAKLGFLFRPDTVLENSSLGEYLKARLDGRASILNERLYV
jgi:hypothetical protein